MRRDAPRFTAIWSMAKYGREIIDHVRVDQAHRLKDDRPARKVVKSSLGLLLRNRETRKGADTRDGSLTIWGALAGISDGRLVQRLASGLRERGRIGAHLSKWPLPQPRTWADLVNQPQTEVRHGGSATKRSAAA